MPDTLPGPAQSGPLLEITSFEEGDQRVVALIGELDLSNVDAVGAAIREALQASAAVIVDLAELTFIDSSGIGLLLGVAVSENGQNPACSLASPSMAVRRVLEIAGVADRLPWKETALDEH